MSSVRREIETRWAKKQKQDLGGIWRGQNFCGWDANGEMAGRTRAQASAHPLRGVTGMQGVILWSC